MAHEQPKSHPECLFSSDNRLLKLLEQPSKILCHRESEESALTEAHVGVNGTYAGLHECFL